MFLDATFLWQVIGHAEGDAKFIQFGLEIRIIDVPFDPQFARFTFNITVCPDLPIKREIGLEWESMKYPKDEIKRTSIGMGGSQLTHFEDTSRIRSMYFR